MVSTCSPGGVISAMPGASTGPVTTRLRLARLQSVSFGLELGKYVSGTFLFPEVDMHAKKAVGRFTGPLKLVL